MADVAALLAYRNARLRAWRAHGVPVEGGWWGGSIKVRCTVCGADGEGGVVSGDIGAAARCEHLAIATCCEHLAPLLGEDPPEIVDLTRLELLAGDPPR
jgi:hypothetical protein